LLLVAERASGDVIIDLAVAVVVCAIALLCTWYDFIDARPPFSLGITRLFSRLARGLTRCSFGSSVTILCVAWDAITTIVNDTIAVIVFLVAEFLCGGDCTNTRTPGSIVLAGHGSALAHTLVHCRDRSGVATFFLAWLAGTIVVDLAVAIVVNAIARLFFGKGLAFANRRPDAFFRADLLARLTRFVLAGLYIASVAKCRFSFWTRATFIDQTIAIFVTRQITVFFCGLDGSLAHTPCAIETRLLSRDTGPDSFVFAVTWIAIADVAVLAGPSWTIRIASVCRWKRLFCQTNVTLTNREFRRAIRGSLACQCRPTSPETKPRTTNKRQQEKPFDEAFHYPSL
jgi:hypothetical protein